MLRNAITKSVTACRKRHFSDHKVKVYKFLALPSKKTTRIKEQNLPPPTKLDEATAEHLEKVSLVGLQNQKIIQIVEEAIRFADQILIVDTTNVKPLVTVLESESLYLREDKAKPDVSKRDLISQCEESQENYFITSFGNLEYIPEQKSFELQSSKQVCKN